MPRSVTILRAHSADYSIHYFEPHHLLIAHMRYIGPPDQFQAKMGAIKDDAKTREWWQVGFSHLSASGTCDAVLTSPADGWDAEELCTWCYGERERSRMVD